MCGQNILFLVELTLIMHVETYADSHTTEEHSHHVSSFWVRVATYFVKDIVEGISIVPEMLRFVTSFLYGFILYLLEFAVIKEWTVKILKPVLIYFLGTSLTHLPVFMVIVLAFSPVPFAAIVIYISFIAMFLV